MYTCGANKILKYNELLMNIENLIQKQMLNFTDITMTPIKAIFSLECEILEELLKAMIELQRLQFLPSLALINGAHTRLSAWENKMQNRDVIGDSVVFVLLFKIDLFADLEIGIFKK